MSLRDTLDRIVAEHFDRGIPAGTHRDTVLTQLPGKADVVIGMRRSGKTWLLFQHMRALVESGVPRERLLYLDLEDERLQPLAASDLQRIPEAWFRRFPEAAREECWLFLDEVHTVSGWEGFVRRMVETPRRRVVLTGSSAKLLSREVATSMRGRSLPTELLPFSFRESLRHAGVRVPDRWPPPPAAQAALEHHLARYLRAGGFPEVQGLVDEARVRVLRDYVDVVLFRDIVERHEVSNIAALRYLVRRLLSAPAGRFSVNRFYNDLRSQGISVGKDTLHAYLAHLEDAFLVFAITIESESERARMVNPRKVYLVDPAIGGAGSFEAARQRGHLLENVVYLELRRRGYACSYITTASGWEVDLLARPRHTGEPLLVQASADLSDPDTREREQRALTEAMVELGLAAGLIVTLFDDEEHVETDAGTVRVVPAWRWLLEDAPAASPPRGARP